MAKKNVKFELPSGVDIRCGNAVATVIVGLVNLKESDVLPLLKPCIAVIPAINGLVISMICKLVASIDSFVMNAVWFDIIKSYFT